MNPGKINIITALFYAAALFTSACEMPVSDKPAVTPSAPPLIAKVTFAIGDVSIKSGDEQYKTAIPGDSVKEGDTIATKDKASAVIQIADKGIIKIEQNSLLIIKNLFSGPEGEVILKEGAILSKFQKLKRGETYGVHMPTAVAAIRGTEFSAAYSEGKSTIAVKSGRVAVAQAVQEGISAAQAVSEAEKEILVESGKTAEAREIPASGDLTERQSRKVSIEVRNISRKEELAVEKISAIEIIDNLENRKNSELQMNRENIIKNDSALDKKIEAESGKDRALEKQARIDTLIQKKPKNLQEIKEAFERIDEITLFNGRVIKGAIVSRGDKYRILTTGGMISVAGTEVRGVKVIK